MPVIYLDYAAATPIDKRVMKAMTPYFSDKFYNPSAAYMAARGVRADVENARHDIAKIIGARPAEIIFTAGATESINLAMTVVGGGVVLTDNAEHASVLNAAKSYRHEIISVDSEGRINLDDLRAKVQSDAVRLISLGYVNSETGVVQDVKAVADIVCDERAERQMPLYLHIDASQASGLYDLNVGRLGVDMMTLNAGKCYGPKQVGLLYARAGIQLKPVVLGGGQEMGLRSGTENVPGIIGFARALQIADDTRKSEYKRLEKLKNQLKKTLANGLPDIIFNENPHATSPAILNFSVPNVDGERVVFALDEKGVMVATGSACAANKGQRSHVLTAMDLTDNIADGSIRVSLGRFMTEEDIAEAGRLIVETINEQRKFGRLEVA